jgi:amino-acid N-acetyltransferase
MAAAVTLAPARAEDIPFIVGLLEENGLPASDAPEKIDSLYLARTDGGVVGIGGVECLGEYGLLRSLAVLPEARNKGYGRAITHDLMARAKRQGVRELYLLTMTAREFFEREGFERIDRSLAPEPLTQTSQFSCL